MNYPSIKVNFITAYCRLDRSPNSTVLTYFSELLEKAPFGEISVENFLPCQIIPKLRKLFVNTT